jgi:hypothetical protein
MLLSNSDFVRNWIAAILNARYPGSFRILERTNYSYGSYYSLPVLKKFINDPRPYGQVSWKASVYFPSSLFGRGIDVHLPPDYPLSLTTADKGHVEYTTFGWRGGWLFNFAYIQSPATVPWDGVRIQDGRETLDAIYTALLDRALGFLASGKTDDALTTLDDAASLVPKSNLEAARLVALQYNVVDGSFHGNIGQLQSLPLLHRTFDLFLEASKDPRFSEKDPLTIWLRQTLLDGYKASDWSFFERFLRLKEILPADNAQPSYFDLLKESLEGKPADDILNSLKTANYSPKDLYFIKNLVITDMLLRLIFDFQHKGALDGGETEMTTEWAGESKEIFPIIQYIDKALVGNGELSSDLLVERFLKYMRDDWPKVMATTNEIDFKRLASQESDVANVLPDQGILQSILDNTAADATFLKGRDYECSTLEYWLWFAHWSEDALVEIDQHNYPWKSDFPPVRHDMHQLISEFGADSFIRDRGGKGRTFLPGLFCFTWYAETFNIPGNEEFKQEFELETLIPFDSYLSSLEHHGESEMSSGKQEKFSLQ